MLLAVKKILRMLIDSVVIEVMIPFQQSIDLTRYYTRACTARRLEIRGKGSDQGVRCKREYLREVNSVSVSSS